MMCRTASYLLVAAAVATGCSDSASTAADGGAADADTNLPPARTDRATPVGSDTTIDIATWNLENFPKRASTAETTADLIASLALDLVVLQEIQSIERFDEIVARLPGYQGILSNHTYGDGSYQKLGYIYKADILDLSAPALLFQNSGYEFPRPPFEVHVQVVGSDLDFDVIGIHLKAGFGGEDEDRRLAALELLESNVRSGVEGSGDEDVIVIGDYNETLDQGADILAPFLDDSAAYTFETALLAAGDEYTFIPSQNLIDHVVTTTALEDELAGGETVIPPLVDEVPGYTSEVSDHLPVILTFPAP